jgi:hypothetical protein
VAWPNIPVLLLNAAINLTDSSIPPHSISVYDSKRENSQKNRRKLKETAMESLLEIQRRCHEERERLVKVMVDEFLEKNQSDKDKIFSDHRIKIYLDVSAASRCSYSNLTISPSPAIR